MSVSRMNIDRCIYIYSIHSYTVIYIYIHNCSTHYSYMLVIDGYMGSMFFLGVSNYMFVWLIRLIRLIYHCTCIYNMIVFPMKQHM